MIDYPLVLVDRLSTQKTEEARTFSLKVDNPEIEKMNDERVK